MHSQRPHYVVITAGTTGDVHPFIRIAKSFQAIGRRVTFITHTFHAKLLHGSGLTFVGFGTEEEYLRIIQDPNIWHPRRGFSALLASYGDQLLQLDSAIRSTLSDGPVVLIAHPLTVPGAAIARDQALVSQIVSMHLAPSTLRTCRDPLRVGEMTVPKWVPMSWRRAYWRFVEKGWVDPVALAQTNQARRALGLLDVRSSFVAHIEEVPNLTVTLFPSWFGPTMPDWPQPMINADFQLFDSASGESFSPELHKFIDAGERPLVFTPGTGNLHANRFFSCALAAAANLGQRAILLTRERSQFPAELPSSVLWQPYVPLAGLLPRVKALVHHGGVGTTAEAFRAATPQLVTPFAWDQFDNAARVEELGAGVVLRASRVSARRFTNAIRHLITSQEMHSRCQQISRQFSSRGDSSELCREIEANVLSRMNLSAASTA